MPFIGKVLSFSSILKVGAQLNNNKPLGTLEMGVLYTKIPENIKKLCLLYALIAHEKLGCRGVTRTDFRWNEKFGIKGLFVLELNTQPGMTPTSLVPEQANYIGMSFEELCEWLIKDASYDKR